MIISINAFENTMFLVETYMWYDENGVHIDTHLVMGDIKKYLLSCETYEV